MGGGVEAYPSAIRKFATDVYRRLAPAPRIERDLGDGCGDMPECQFYATCDRDSSNALDQFLTEAEQGMQTFVSMASRCAVVYETSRGASEDAIWAVTGRPARGAEIRPVDGMTTNFPALNGSLWPGLPLPPR